MSVLLRTPNTIFTRKLLLIISSRLKAGPSKKDAAVMAARVLQCLRKNFSKDTGHHFRKRKVLSRRKNSSPLARVGIFLLTISLARWGAHAQIFGVFRNPFSK